MQLFYVIFTIDFRLIDLPTGTTGVSKEAPKEAPLSTKQAHGGFAKIEPKLNRTGKTVRKQAFLMSFFQY